MMRVGLIAVLLALVLHGSDAHAAHRFGEVTDWWDAAEGGKLARIIELFGHTPVDMRNRDGQTALLIAAERGHAEIVKLLLAAGADMNARGHRMMGTALIAAALGGHLNIVRALVGKGADVEAMDQNGMTPLIAAAVSGHPGLVRLLLSKGADVDAKDREGMTALMLARERGHTDAMRLLEQAKARADAGEMFAEGEPEQVQLERKRRELERAEVEVDQAKAEAAKARAEAARVKAEADRARAEADMARMEAEGRAREEGQADLGMEEPAEPDARIEPVRGRTPAMWWRAVEAGRARIVMALLGRGADVHARNERGQTALHIAAAQGHHEVAKVLLLHGADPKARDEHGVTPLMIAERRGDPRFVRLLMEAEARRGGGRPLPPEPPAQQPPIEAEKARAEVDKARAEAEKAKAEAEKAKAEAEKAKAEAEKAKVTTPAPSAPARVPPAEATIDIERLPQVIAKTQPGAYAVVIGIEKYTDLVPPDFAVRDAATVKDYLVHVLGYPEENIRLLTNEQATRSRVQSALETWLPNQEPTGSVFVYYSGHGAPDPATGEPYLVPSDGSPQDLKQTGYALKQLAGALQRLPAKELIVVMDSCFSGQPGTRSVIAKGTKPMVITAEGPWAALGERGIVFTAGNQVSTVYQEKKHGLFTYFFLKGLQGAADRNNDGAVQVEELFAYLRPEVVKTARRQNVDQEPGLWPTADRLGPRASRALAVVKP